MHPRERCAHFCKLGSVLFLLPLVQFMLPDVFYLAVEYTAPGGNHTVPTGRFVQLMMSHQWDVRFIMMQLTFFTICPVAGSWIKRPRRGDRLLGYGALAVWVAAFAIGTSRPSALTWVASWAAAQKIPVYLMIVLLYALLLVLAIHFRAVQYGLSAVLGLSIIWGGLATGGLCAYTGQISVSLAWLTLMLWPGLLLLRGWYAPTSRWISVMALLSYTAVTALFVWSALINPQMHITDKLSILCLVLGLVCLLTDTVCIFRARRRTLAKQ